MVLQKFATAAQMEARSNGAIPADRPFLDTALEAASRRIRDYCGWHIWPVLPVEDLRVRTHHGHYLWLPTTQLVSLQGITNGGVALHEDSLELVDFSADGRVDFTGWGAPSLVSFTHGYESVPDLVDLTLELATGELQSSGGASREQTLASSVTWARTSGKLTRDDKDDLAPYKIGYQP